MSYDDIVAVFMSDDARSLPAPDLPDTPARRLRDALEPIATQGWWSRPAADAMAPLGVDFFTAYVWGRAAALGVPTPAVVAATFGVFQADVIGAVYAAGSAGIDRDAVLAARQRGGEASVRSVADDDEADTVAQPLLRALDSVDGLGRPLFSALRALPRPDSGAGRLWRAAELVREHRGDCHLAAIVVSGLDMAEANVLTEVWLGYRPGEYSATRAMSPEAIAATVDRLTAAGLLDDAGLTTEGRRRRDDLEAATDRGQDALVAALGDRIGEVIAGAQRIGDRLLAAGAVPTDARKRAAG